MRSDGLTDLRLGHQSVIAIAEGTVWQAELLLHVPLAEEFFQQQIGPVAMSDPRFARMSHVAAVQDQRQDLGLVDAQIGAQQQILGRFDLLEVTGHVRGQDHVDDQRTELAELFTRQIDQNVAVLFTHQPEGGADVVVLQNCPVVVQQCRFRAGHDVEAVGGARVLKVVNDGGQQGGKDLQVGQPVHQTRLEEDVVHRLRHVGRVHVVVVQVAIFTVTGLRLRQEALQRVVRDLTTKVIFIHFKIFDKNTAAVRLNNLAKFII